MDENKTPRQCIHCARSIDEVPLIPLFHRGGQVYICPQCMPVLIHQPQIFVGKLSGAEALEPREHGG
jgi:hypothetical protein